MSLPLFWIALICQVIIVLGYFWFYRKEQLGMSAYLYILWAICEAKF